MATRQKLQKWLAIYKGQSNCFTHTPKVIIIIVKSAEMFPRNNVNLQKIITYTSYTGPMRDCLFTVEVLNCMFVQLGYLGGILNIDLLVV